VAITRFRVKEAFSATLLPTRRRERFVPGELIVLVDGSEIAFRITIHSSQRHPA